jgi:regulation of enolase protein 1 (concanavalin A-like superfamily)
VPRVCPLSRPQRAHVGVRQRREPDAIRLNATLTRKVYALLYNPARSAGFPAAEVFEFGGTIMVSNKDPTARLR